MIRSSLMLMTTSSWRLNGAVDRTCMLVAFVCFCWWQKLQIPRRHLKIVTKHIYQHRSPTLMLLFYSYFRAFPENNKTTILLDINLSAGIFINGTVIRKNYFFCGNSQSSDRQTIRQNLISPEPLNENDQFCKNNGLRHISIRMIIKNTYI